MDLIRKTCAAALISTLAVSCGKAADSGSTRENNGSSDGDDSISANNGVIGDSTANNGMSAGDGEAMNNGAVAEGNNGIVEGGNNGTGGPAPQAGQLTAAEWNDLLNWGAWINLVGQNVAGFADYAQQSGIDTTGRVWVRVLSDGSGAVDARVELIDAADAVGWTARTDIHGDANLYVNPFGGDFAPTSIRVTHDTETVTAALPDPIDPETAVTVDLQQQHAVPQAVDVAFVVDATGSMGDELSYIHAELADVIARADAEVDANFRVAGVVYRDPDADGVDFGTAAGAASFLSGEAATGGGDFPEAVNAGLDLALGYSWSDSARARLLFLVLDAPPHGDDLGEIRQLTELAAQKGVRVIPVAASGVDKFTEQLLRSMAILSSGTYTFITDDSGIGNDHLEPTVGDYKVEFLNDLLFRLIVERSRPD